MSRRYERMDIETFGVHLLTSGDLDPVYLAVPSITDDGQRRRWLVAYAAYYHCGAACWLSEQTGRGFWDAMMMAAKNVSPAPDGGRWPRGHERRHFRGAQAVAGIADWSAKHPNPETLFDCVADAGPRLSAVIERAREYRSVGSWLAFKVADLIDACLGVDLDQSEVDLFLYDTPFQSLLAEYERRHGIPHEPDVAASSMMEMLRQRFSRYDVPHKPGKQADLFCLETIACKHGSHMSGHYPLYNDIDDITRGMQSWLATCATARAFLAAMPQRPVLR